MVGFFPGQAMKEYQVRRRSSRRFHRTAWPLPAHRLVHREWRGRSARPLRQQPTRQRGRSPAGFPRCLQPQFGHNKAPTDVYRALIMNIAGRNLLPEGGGNNKTSHRGVSATRLGGDGGGCGSARRKAGEINGDGIVPRVAGGSDMGSGLSQSVGTERVRGRPVGPPLLAAAWPWLWPS